MGNPKLQKAHGTTRRVRVPVLPKVNCIPQRIKRYETDTHLANYTKKVAGFVHAQDMRHSDTPAINHLIESGKMVSPLFLEPWDFFVDSASPLHDTVEDTCSPNSRGYPVRMIFGDEDVKHTQRAQGNYRPREIVGKERAYCLEGLLKEAGIVGQAIVQACEYWTRTQEDGLYKEYFDNLTRFEPDIQGMEIKVMAAIFKVLGDRRHNGLDDELKYLKMPKQIRNVTDNLTTYIPLLQIRLAKLAGVDLSTITLFSDYEADNTPIIEPENQQGNNPAQYLFDFGTVNLELWNFYFQQLEYDNKLRMQEGYPEAKEQAESISGAGRTNATQPNGIEKFYTGIHLNSNQLRNELQRIRDISMTFE